MREKVSFSGLFRKSKEIATLLRAFCRVARKKKQKSH